MYTLQAGGNPSTQTWALMFLCPICGWKNPCRPGKIKALMLYIELGSTKTNPANRL